MYYRTYKFMDQIGDDGETVCGGHKLRMNLVFAINDTGIDEAIYRDETSIRIFDWGELNLEGQIKDPLLFINDYSFSLYDKANELHDFLFEGLLFNKVDKAGEVIIEILYEGEESYIEKYRGYIINFDQPDMWDYKTRIFSFNVAPRTDILDQIRLDRVNPDATQARCNPFSYTGVDVNYGGKLKWTFYPVKVTTLFEDIFKKVDANITLDFRNTWQLTLSGYPPFAFEDEVYFSSTAIGVFFGARSNPLQLTSLKDLLKRLAFSLFSIAGMESSHRAFIKELFTFDQSNTQTLEYVKHIQKGFGEQRIDAVTITSRYYRRDLNPPWEYLEDPAKSFSVTFPVGAAYRGDNTIDEEVPLMTAIGAGVDGSFYFKDGANYYLINDPAIRTFGETQRSGTLAGGLLVQLYWLLLGEINSIRMDTFIVRGLNYSFMKDFSYGGNNYSILKMRQKLTKNETEIGAIYISEDVSNGSEPDPDDVEKKILPLTLPTGFYKIYPYIRAITPDEANVGQVDLVTIDIGEHLEEISILAISDDAPAPIGFAGITNMYVADNDGTLMEADRIIWIPEDRNIQEPVRRYVGKNYETQQTVKIYFDGTATNGNLNVYLKVWAPK